MFTKLIGPAATAAVLAISVAAQALTITNRDASDYELTVEDDDGETALAIAANGTAEAACPKGCVLILGDGEPIEVGADAAVTIEDGKLKL